MMMEEKNTAQTSAEPAPSGVGTPEAIQPRPVPASPDPYKTFYSVFALILPILGFLYVKWIILNVPGLGGTIFILLFLVMTAFFAYFGKAKKNLPSILLLVVCALFAPVFTLTANDTIRGLTLLFETLLILYWYLYAFGNCQFLTGSLPLDLLKAVLQPFGSLGSWFKALGRPLKKTKNGKTFLLILLGLLCALIPTVTVVILLAESDIAFSALGKKLFSPIGPFLNENLLPLILMIPVTMYLYGMMIASLEKRYPNFIGEDAKKGAARALRFAPVVFVCTVIIPLCIVYVLFFFSQLSYYLDAFSGLLPEGYSYAEYARSGFFELCRVAVINTLVMIVSLLIVKRNDTEKLPRPVQILSLILSVFTLLLIATAIRKMVLYMEAYGLTQLRVYTSWFMLLLGVIYLAVILRLVIEKLPFPTVCAVIFTLFFAFLAYGQVDARIAESNISRYQSGDLPSVDIAMLEELSDEAFPYIVSLSDDRDPWIREEVARYLTRRCKEFAHNDFPLSSYNLPKAYARDYCKKINAEIQNRQ